MNTREKVAESTEKRLQFVVALSLFFPVLIEALGSASNQSTSQVSTSVLQTSIVVFFSILNYVLFEWRKDKLPLQALKYIGWIFIFIASCFAIVVLISGLSSNATPGSPDLVTKYSSYVGIYGILWTPILTATIMILNFVFEEIKFLKTTVTHISMR